MIRLEFPAPARCASVFSCFLRSDGPLYPLADIRTCLDCDHRALWTAIETTGVQHRLEIVEGDPCIGDDDLHLLVQEIGGIRRIAAQQFLAQQVFPVVDRLVAFVADGAAQ